MQQWVSDDFWQQLDPRAGALSRNQRRRAVAVASVAAVVLTAGFAADRSGAVRARVEYDRDTSLASSATVNPKILTQQVPVKNTGWTTVRVVGIGQDGPGLRLVGPADPEGMKLASEMGGTPPPFDLHPGQTVIMVVTYRVTDCTAVTAGPFPVPVRVDRPWGTETIGVSLPQRAPTTPGFTVNGPELEWQKAAADQVCKPHH